MRLNLRDVRRCIVLVGFVQAGLLVLDVAVALRTGKYLTAALPRVPVVMPYTWTNLFVIRGVDVASTGVHTLFFAGAAVWLLATAAFVWSPDRTWWVLIVVALLGFWYAPLGIWLGVVEIVLLSTFRLIMERA